MKILKNKTISYQEFTEFMISAKDSNNIICDVVVDNCRIHSMPEKTYVFSVLKKKVKKYFLGFIPYIEIENFDTFNGYVLNNVTISNNFFTTKKIC